MGSKKQRYSVPIITETTDVYEIIAQSPAHAAYEANSNRAAGVEPTHSHSVTRLGTTKLTIEDGSLAAAVRDADDA